MSKLEISCLWVAMLAASATLVVPGKATGSTPKLNPEKLNSIATGVKQTQIQDNSPLSKSTGAATPDVLAESLPTVMELPDPSGEGVETALPALSNETEGASPEDLPQLTPTVADLAVSASPAPKPTQDTQLDRQVNPKDLPQLTPNVADLAVSASPAPKPTQDTQLDRQVNPKPNVADLEAATASPAPNPTEPLEVDGEKISQPEIAQSPPASPNRVQPAPQPEVLVAEVVIRGATTAELEDLAYSAIGTRPGRTTTRARLIEDANAIYATGYFANVEPVAEETPLGVRVVFTVTPNPVLNQVSITGNQVLPAQKIDEFFGDQYGRILNFRDFQDGIDRLNQWYQDNGYVLAQVIDPAPDSAPVVDANGRVTLDVAEGQIEAFDIRFRNEDGDIEDADGNPIEGRTKEYVITREMRLQEGDVFNRTVLLDDLGRIVRLGLFEDAEFTIEPGTDPRKVVVVLNAVEGSFGSFNFGGGFSSATGLFGSVGAEFLNIGGRNQRLGGEAQLGTRGLFFDVRFTDPWIAGDPYRTSFSANIFNRRSISLVFDGSEEGDRQIIELDNGDRPRVQRLGGQVNFTRPLSYVCPYPDQAERCDNIERPALEKPDWVGSLGLEFENVSIRDGDGDIEPEDEEGNLLSFNDDGSDNLLNLQFGLSRDRRNSTLQATDGSYLRFSSDQSIPIDGIFFNRVRAGYSYYLPVKLTDFADGAQALAFNIEAGTILGDLPPYEAFAIGGTNSVRGFEEGDVGVGRSFAQATVEYRFPVFSVIGGALFVDAATTFGTQDNVPGDPGGARGKPGSGIGYGVGVRIQSPIGPIRIDYGLNNEGDNRFHFGIGERF